MNFFEFVIQGSIIRTMDDRIKFYNRTNCATIIKRTISDGIMFDLFSYLCICFVFCICYVVVSFIV